jgi:hypothetical protein
MSLLGNCGLSLLVYEPLVMGGDFVGNYTEKVSSYGHDIVADGGYWACSFQFTDTQGEIEKWFRDGLERHIVIRDDALGVIFEGFVNQISINAGAESDVRGPVMSIANRVSCVYSPKDVSVYPPVIGAETTTIIVDNVASQAKYGILEKILSAGTITEEEVIMVRDMYLAQYKDPTIAGTMSIGATGQVTATIDCLGYIHLLSVYVFEDDVVGYSYLSDKIKAVLAFNPNHIFSTLYYWIQDNLMLVGTAENQHLFGLDIINRIVTLGDIYDTRWTFGIYENRTAKYAAIPTDRPEYLFYLSDPTQKILSYKSQATISPWNVMPGKWIFVPDYYIGYVVGLGTPDSADPRYKFIETVKYTAPNQLDISGGRTDRLSQMFAKLGMSGI